ncbi:protein kinase superfamily protein [Striga asiatica]|uniref:Protein kinase superfamily protein n=1 Tax=Striga asiatica TaxID=4170 RepID=A0A5A7Q8R0_STRAF|nr:protein kinase superfamily protein [Striga asiatica]
MTKPSKLIVNGDDENPLPLLISLLYSVSTFSPTGNHLVDCGSRAAVTRDFDHQDFTGDDSQFLTSTVDDNDREIGSSLGTFFSLYATAGASIGPRTTFSRSETCRNTHHLIRLHFHPLENDSHNFYKVEFYVPVVRFLPFAIISPKTLISLLLGF